tara:strand:+ start:2462 stop:2851 length:390 start_codon:yes stop_codon:yes gene_type:complete
LGPPQRCSKCKTDDLHACKWKISYENVYIDDFFKKHGAFNLGNFTENEIHVDNNGVGRKITGTFDFIRMETDKIESITGKISVSISNKVNMTQYFCNKCRNTLKLEDLPKSWGYEETYRAEGFKLILLP